MKNTTQKILIETLTITHTNPMQAYLQALQQLQEQEDKEQVKRIAKKFNIKGV